MTLENLILKDVTFCAQEKIKTLLEQHAREENKPPADYRLRMYVQGGGCAGFQYGFVFDAIKNDGDTIQKFGDIEIIIDPMSSMYLHYVSIDYTETLAGAGFKINNPNTIGGCGCGNSFSV